MKAVRITALRCAILVAVVLQAGASLAQSFNRAGAEFDAVRSVTVPAAKSYTIIVTEFYHQGEIRPDGRNVVVVAQNKELVPMRVLQLGPGDFCRLAFQTIAGQSEYDIFYGGDPPREKSPSWTCRDGLLLETRQYRQCNLSNFDSVRKAFDNAVPFGADYVDGVLHHWNPFSLGDVPFFSRYSGYLDVRRSGVYGFILSSRDCSFLLIDDKLVASEPGRHHAPRRAMRGSRSDVQLTAGPHKFAYYHAAASDEAVMIAAWEVDPVDEKPENPTSIPSEAFHTHLIGRLPATRLSLRTTRQVPDFVVKILGDVPLPDNDVPLLGVQFRDASIKALTMQGAKLRWDFGDGQTSDMPNVDHVYLRPGLYPVTLSIHRGGKTVQTTNRIYVDRPHTTMSDKLYSLDDYLRIVRIYDPKRLDAPSLRQMALTLEAKALEAARQAENAAEKAKASEDDSNRRRDARRETSPSRKVARTTAPLSDSDRFLTEAVTAGKAAFVEQSAAKGDEDLLKLAQLIGPMARDRLGDSETAFEIWQGAVQRISAAEPKTECEMAAADIAINDLLKPADARRLLEAASKRLGKSRSGPIAARLQRVWGDYYASTGDGKAARAAYVEAERLGGFARPFAAETAARGAHARSTEEFIRDKQFARAAEELQAWQRESPGERMEGYLTLLYARYWAGRGKFAQAIAQAEQLQAVNPDSPYVDQLLVLAAECEMRRDRKDRALATLHSLLKDYPGSPLVPVVKKNIRALEGAGDERRGARD